VLRAGLASAAWITVDDTGVSMLSPDSSKALAENSSLRLVAMSWR
jgi:hypothetical protein